MDIDELIATQPPDVQSAIEELIEAAGTSDADSNVLIEAGKRIAELNRHSRNLVSTIEADENETNELNTQILQMEALRDLQQAQCNGLTNRITTLESGIRDALEILARCRTVERGIGGQTMDATMARTSYVNVPLSVGVDLRAALDGHDANG